MDKKKNQLPLSSIKILDLSRMLPGPYCSMVLADLGAEVIRVENPRYPYANPPPLFRKGRYNESAFNAILMRNKKSIALNLKKEEGKEIFYELAKEADVILETFRPKVVEKLNIGYDTISEINPSIIYCALTGYGQNGPYEQLAGHDMNYLGICGIMNLNRPRTHYDKPDEIRKPVVPGMQCADIGGALVAVIAIQGAIIEREKNESKKGQYIDISMLDSAFSFMPMAAAYHFAQSVNEKPLRSENPLHGAMPYYSVYRTKDNKFLTIGAIEMKFWHQLCEALDRDDLKLKQNKRGVEREPIFQELQKEFLKKTQAEWLKIFQKNDTCVMPVKSFAQACEDPQIKAREMVVKQNHPKFSEIPNVASPINYSRTPLKIRSLAPKTGKHTIEILESLNYSEEEIKELKKKKII